MIITFGVNRGKEIERLEDGYLIWMVKADRGDFPPKRPGEKQFKIPGDQILAARKELKLRGYQFIGSRIERTREEQEAVD